MRRRAVLLLPLLLVASCGSSSSPAKKAAAPGFPTVSGNYGSKPSLVFAGATAPTGLKQQVLKEGTGKTVAKGDLLVADYLGQVYGGKVFDNSYDRGSAAGFAIGVGKVIPGWDKLLVGDKVGSRVLLSVPSADGYGEKGNPQAGILGTDTLEFVVDIVGSYDKSATGDPKAVAQKVRTPGITVTGGPGLKPVLKVAAGTKGVTKPTLVVLAKGTGAPVAPGLLIAQYEAVDYKNGTAGSTWSSGTPAGVNVATTGSNSVFDQVRGLPLGSRVLVEIPAANGQSPVVVVVDLVSQPGNAAHPTTG